MQTLLPLSERDPNVSGRTSRASNFSSGSKGGHRKHHNANASKSGALSAAPGVLGMLRTTTEIGDVGSLAISNRVPRITGHHRGSNRKNGTASRMSAGSASSQPAAMTSHHHVWPSVSSASRRRSITSNTTAPPFVEHGGTSFSIRPESPPGRLMPHSYSLDAGRSFSLTNAMAPSYGFSHNRSLTSLRSRVEPYPRSKSPFRYPTRLKRPGYRPSSPALSDLAGAQSFGIGPSHGSRLRPGQWHPIAPVPRYPAPYPTQRNRSAPTVPGISTIRGYRQQGLTREDTPSLSEQSMDQAKPTVAFKNSVSFQTHSRTSTNPQNVPSSEPPSSTPSTPPTLSIFHPAIASQSTTSVNIHGLGSVAPAYYDYTEDYNDLKKEVTEIFNETMPDSPMPFGFIQRVRALLEENKNEGNPSSETSEERFSGIKTPKEDIIDPPIPGIAELPATPVASPTVRRITREMIIQALRPSSENLEPSTTIDSTPPSHDVPDESLSHSPDDHSPVEETEQVSLGSASQSVYSRPTNATENTDATPIAVVDEPVSTIPSPDMASSSCTTELKKSLSLQSGANTSEHCQIRRSTSSISVPRLPSPIPADDPKDTLNKSKRRWSIRRTTLGPSGSQSVRKHGKTELEIPGSAADTFPSSIQMSYNVPPSVITSDQQAGTNAASSSGNVNTVLPPSSGKASIIESHSDSSPWSYDKLVASSTTTFSSVDGSVKDPNTDAISADIRSNTTRLAVGLPDVKEEPNLESYSDLRHSNGFNFPFGKTSVAKGMLETIRNSKEKKEHRQSRESKITRSSKDAESIAQSSQPQSMAFKPPAQGLAAIHGIPSLNFSRVNLLTKLNDALELRRASLGSEYADLMIEAPERPCRPDSGIMRAKYRSLFLSLEDMVLGADALAELAAAEGMEMPDTNDLPECTSVEEEFGNAIPTLRPLSPDELINEINRISVPSIGGLTQRISEIFPSLKRHLCELEVPQIKEDDPLESTIDEIRGLGKIDIDNEIDTVGPEWRFSVATAQDISFDVTMPIHKPADSHTRVSVSFEGHRQSYQETCSAKRPLSLPSPGIPELPGSFPNGGRMRSFSDSEVDTSILERMNKLAKQSYRSMRSPNGDIRPWNLDSSYPWSNSIPYIDIHFPATPSPLQNSLTARPSHRRTLSNPDTSNEAFPNFTNAAIAHNSDRPMSADIVSPNTAPPVTTTKRGTSKKQTILDHLSRKVLGAGLTAAATSSKLASFNNDVKTNSDILRSDDRSVDPGDRYPTTGLTPPTAVLNLDDVHSFFSDDSSATARQPIPRPRANSLRKRLTSGLRFRLTGHELKVPRSRPATAGGAPTRQSHAQMYLARGEQLKKEDSPEAMFITTATGMPKGEVKAKRLVDRLKLLFYRGGELLRTMSGRRRNPRLLEEGDEASWSENGESFADWQASQGYDAGATAILGDFGPGSSRMPSSRAASLMATP